MRATAFIGLGSNLGDREGTLCEALARLERNGAASVSALSRFRETEPVGGPSGQPRYLNAVARVETDLAPRELLAALLATEEALGRVRTPGAERWGPRPVDLDLLLYFPGEGGPPLEIDEPGLQLPHPRILERSFVTEPLAEIAPEALDALRRKCSTGGARRAGEDSKPMEWIDSIERMRAFSRAARAAGRTIGFVPTMGALHEGHLSLVRRARAENDVAVASIFVNPLQFGPNEDYARYPRDPEGDRRLLASAGCHAAFTTTPEAMYPPGFRTYVVQEDLATKLEGASRPGHFRGVLTVVLKLFEIVRPDRAYFGQKDFQQTVVIGRMIRDFCLDVEMVVCPTVREADGLAMSSRNRYLGERERADAASLSRGLAAAQRLFRGGERDPSILRRAIEEPIRAAPTATIDYVAIVDAEHLDPVAVVRPGDVALVAARIGSTRLIDNARFE